MALLSHRNLGIFQ